MAVPTIKPAWRGSPLKPVDAQGPWVIEVDGRALTPTFTEHRAYEAADILTACWPDLERIIRGQSEEEGHD